MGLTEIITNESGDIADKRKLVSEVYSFWKWKTRVSSMSKKEILDTYNKLVKQGKIKVERTHNTCRYKPSGVDICTRGGGSNSLVPGGSCARWKARKT